MAESSADGASTPGSQLELLLDPGQSERVELSDEEEQLEQRLRWLYAECESIGIKKLSKNDRSWAWPVKESNQSGFYVPIEFRGSLLPSDAELTAQQPGASILLRACPSLWFVGGEWKLYSSNYRRFLRKGTEGHFTVVPKALFGRVNPASFVVMGRLKPGRDAMFACVLVDSLSPLYSGIEGVFGLSPSFLAGTFDPPLSLTDAVEQELQRFIEELTDAVKRSTIEDVVDRYRQIPKAGALSLRAQREWLAANEPATLDPFHLPYPGNVLQELTTEVEFKLYKYFELRLRTSRMVSLLFPDGPTVSINELVSRIVQSFSPLYELMRDASQQRRTRVGSGFEAHIRTMLTNGDLPFDEQAIVSTRRPDFVLPSLRPYADGNPTALVLAAKTTLRERWKQVPLESRNCRVFLATLDEKVTRSAVKEMNRLNIALVVPESFVGRRTVVEYASEPNVFTFKRFFEEEIMKERRPRWISAGLWPIR